MKCFEMVSANSEQILNRTRLSPFLPLGLPITSKLFLKKTVSSLQIRAVHNRRDSVDWPCLTGGRFRIRCH